MTLVGVFEMFKMISKSYKRFYWLSKCYFVSDKIFVPIPYLDKSNKRMKRSKELKVMKHF